MINWGNLAMVKRKGSSRKVRPAGTIAKYLTDLRLEKKLTQQEIADKIHKSRSYICKIETGERERKSVPQESLRGFILYELAKAYKADLAEILEKANSPQLLLLDTTEEERQELIRRLKEIRLRKNKDRKY